VIYVRIFDVDIVRELLKLTSPAIINTDLTLFVTVYKLLPSMEVGDIRTKSRCRGWGVSAQDTPPPPPERRVISADVVWEKNMKRGKINREKYERKAEKRED
jgi:hypothetical protein